MSKQGIDISNNQGNIDFATLKNHVDFVIIRVGWGSDIASQDDPKFSEYVQGCIANNIPFGLYLYSYALTSQDVTSEIAHMLRLYNSISDKRLLTYGLWFDMEDADGYKANHGQPLAQYGDLYASFCNTWVDGVKAATSALTGVYASLSPLSNELRNIRTNIPKWVACWSNTQPTFDNMFMWQNSNDGSFPGISGRVDTDVLIGETPSTTNNGDGQNDDVYPTTPEKAVLEIGSIIKIRSGACDLNSGNTFASFVYDTTYDVKEVSGRRVVFGNENGITGVVDIDDVIAFGGADPIQEKTVCIGAAIKIKDGAKDMNTGTTYASWVYNSIYQIKDITDNGSRIVFGNENGITGATHISNIILV